jgi:AraC-like DNA-binding protein
VRQPPVAHACNYYDQAHFNKDFLAFSGLNPSNYLAQRSKWYGDSLRQGEAGETQ